jgi:tRNA pseudouridine55 synthase
MDKEYIAGLRLGIATDTQDITGTITAQSPGVLSRDALERTLDAYRGEILQLPPMYSAVKIGGERLYAIARRGGEVEREPRPVTVYVSEILSGDGADWVIRFVVSKGTYVRTLCHDIGQTLGCGGVMSSLRRTRVGEFRIEDALDVIRAAELAAGGGLDEYLIRELTNR